MHEAVTTETGEDTLESAAGLVVMFFERDGFRLRRAGVSRDGAVGALATRITRSRQAKRRKQRVFIGSRWERGGASRVAAVKTMRKRARSSREQRRGEIASGGGISVIYQRMKFTYYGHACFSVEGAGKTLLFDPFITPNPLAEAIDIETIPADFILVSHGHVDHICDVEAIAKRTGAP
jgi:hypothetical protein